jgi:hypothetical protein
MSVQITWRAFPGIAGGAINNLSDVSISSAAQGDILYNGGTSWNNLAAGAVANNPLVTEGASANPNWSTTIAVDTVTESTSANGVAIDSVTLKDGGIVCADGASIEVDTVSEATSANGVLVDGVKCKDGELILDASDSSGAGVVTLKDNGAGVLLVRDGDDSEAAGVTMAALTATTGTFSGALSATTGSFSDNVTIADDKYIYFGSDSDGYIRYRASTDQLQISGTSANGTVFLRDVDFSGNITMSGPGVVDIDTSTDGLKVNTINESSNGNGVVVDGVRCKDGEIRLDNSDSSGAGVVTLKDNGSGVLLVRDGDDSEAAGVTMAALTATTGTFSGQVAAADLEVDIINEATTDNGVTVEGVQMIDGSSLMTNSTMSGTVFTDLIRPVDFGTTVSIGDNFQVNNIGTVTSVTIANSGTIYTDVIAESIGSGNGVDVDGVRCKDGEIRLDNADSSGAGVVTLKDNGAGKLLVRDGDDSQAAGIIADDITVTAYERHIQLAPLAVGNPAALPTAAAAGTAGGYQFASSGAEYLNVQWEVPDDWDGGDVYFEVDWLPDSGATSGTDTVKWDVAYRAIAEGETITNGTAVTVSATDDSDYAQYTTVHSRFTLAYNNANQPLTKQDHVYFQITRDTGVTNDFGGTVLVTAFEVIYNSTSFPTSN